MLPVDLSIKPLISRPRVSSYRNDKPTDGAPVMVNLRLFLRAVSLKLPCNSTGDKRNSGEAANAGKQLDASNPAVSQDLN